MMSLIIGIISLMIGIAYCGPWLAIGVGNDQVCTSTAAGPALVSASR